MNLSNLSIHDNKKRLVPVENLDLLIQEKDVRIILTDSGGVQKETNFFKLPWVTICSDTEWVEKVGIGNTHFLFTETRLLVNMSR